MIALAIAVIVAVCALLIPATLWWLEWSAGKIPSVLSGLILCAGVLGVLFATLLGLSVFFDGPPSF